MILYDPAHPGEVLKDYLAGRSTAEVAAHLGVSRSSLHRVLSGRGAVTPEMSIRLGEALETGPDFWLKMQVQYDLWHAMRARRKKIRPLGKLVAAA